MAAKTSSSKPVAKTKKTDKSKVTDVNTDPLADLGLDVTTSAPVEAPVNKTVVTTVVNTDGATDVSKDEVDVGEIEFGFSEFIPNAKRKVEGSKYKFDQLDAPGVWTEGPHKGKAKIANFTVKLLDGVDADKLRRSVQSATTQANKQGKEAGKYFVSRSLTKGDKFVGMVVYRTDDPPK